MPVRNASDEIPALYSVTVPSGLILPIWFAFCSVNQTLPSAPSAIPIGTAPVVIPALNSVVSPSGVMRPICAPLSGCVNQRLPSAPSVMLFG